MKNEKTTFEHALRQLERSGGVIFIGVYDAGSITLSLGSARRGLSVITGRWEGRPRHRGYPGWLKTDDSFVSKSWNVRTDLDRRRLRTDIEQALDQLRPRSLYVGPGQDDGFAWLFWIFITASAPVGGLLGLMVALVTGVPAITAIASAIVGVVVAWISGGFLAWGVLRMAQLITRYRPRAMDISLGFALVGPAIVAFVFAIVAGTIRQYE